VAGRAPATLTLQAVVFTALLPLQEPEEVKTQRVLVPLKQALEI
jgi:hypothetical protein